MNKENKHRQIQLLDYLIRYLLDEDKRYKGFILPDRFDEKLRILRSMMNVRLKMLHLVTQDVMLKWTGRIHNWGQISSQVSKALAHFT